MSIKEIIRTCFPSVIVTDRQLYNATSKRVRELCEFTQKPLPNATVREVYDRALVKWFTYLIHEYAHDIKIGLVPNTLREFYSVVTPEVLETIASQVPVTCDVAKSIHLPIDGFYDSRHPLYSICVKFAVDAMYRADFHVKYVSLLTGVEQYRFMMAIRTEDKYCKYFFQHTTMTPEYISRYSFMVPKKSLRVLAGNPNLTIVHVLNTMDCSAISYYPHDATTLPPEQIVLSGLISCVSRMMHSQCLDHYIANFDVTERIVDAQRRIPWNYSDLCNAMPFDNSAIDAIMGKIPYRELTNKIFVDLAVAGKFTIDHVIGNITLFSLSELQLLAKKRVDLTVGAVEAIYIRFLTLINTHVDVQLSLDQHFDVAKFIKSKISYSPVIESTVFKYCDIVNNPLFALVPITCQVQGLSSTYHVFGDIKNPVYNCQMIVASLSAAALLEDHHIFSTLFVNRGEILDHSMYHDRIHDLYFQYVANLAAIRNNFSFTDIFYGSRTDHSYDQITMPNHHSIYHCHYHRTIVDFTNALYATFMSTHPNITWKHFLTIRTPHWQVEHLLAKDSLSLVNLRLLITKLENEQYDEHYVRTLQMLHDREFDKYEHQHHRTIICEKWLLRPNNLNDVHLYDDYAFPIFAYKAL